MKMLVRCQFDGAIYVHRTGSGDCCPTCGRCMDYDVVQENYEESPTGEILADTNEKGDTTEPR